MRVFYKVVKILVEDVGKIQAKNPLGYEKYFRYVMSELWAQEIVN